MENLTPAPLNIDVGFSEFPAEHTCDGTNQSPRIAIEHPDCTSLAVMVFNPSMRGVLSYCAWLIWDIPEVQEIPAGIPLGKKVTSPISALQGLNDAGQYGYTGPCPLPGQTHRYLFRVYGLDDFLAIPAGSNKNELKQAMHDHIIQYGETEALAVRKVA
ncbi:MAG: YbhB/YbcL family Raf kinase inhibitor-like protein [Methanomicrobiales archaeon]|nr:YbhB/YbcL family Raf kinase inhibitor-like protein [Methanomicrobiales archaeon]